MSIIETVLQHFFTEANFARDEVASLDIDMRNIVVKNLSTFTINKAHISLEDLSLRTELTVANLRVREMLIVELCMSMLSPPG